MFTFPMLLWGLPVIAVPLLIHLINMLRQRRVEWAAMEFLRISQRKHQTWVTLKQLLLLLLRMAAVALVVLIVAGPRVPDRWGSLLGSAKLHHIVLLDDSFSMSDRWGDTSAFAQAKKVVHELATAAAGENYRQTFTLLRFSRSGQYGGGMAIDFSKERIDATFPRRLAEKLDRMEVSQTAAEPLPALEAITQLLGEDDQRPIVYLVSDFRARQWDKPAALKKQLSKLNGLKAELQLIDCVDESHANLAITNLAAGEGIRTAGIEWKMAVSVANYGPSAVHNVPVHVTQDDGITTTVTLPEILPGQTAAKEFPVEFARHGEHRLAAWLDADAVAADNFRAAVVDLPAEIPVLLIDGGPKAIDATYLSWALAPGGNVHSGIQPRVAAPRILSQPALDDFGVLAVANVDRLDRSVVGDVERFVREGGGAVFFLGEKSTSAFINEELYRHGEGLFPLPLGNAKALPVDRLEKIPDIQTQEHFLFQGFAEKRNTLLNDVLVGQYFAAAEGWKPPPQSGTRVIVRLRNGAPLVVERGFGKGRVIAFLTTAGPAWNNWAHNETYPLLMRNLFAYLARHAASETPHQVGIPLSVKIDPARYQRQVRFQAPSFRALSATSDLLEREYQRQMHAEPSLKPGGGLSQFSFDENGTVPLAPSADPRQDGWVSVDAQGPTAAPTATFSETGRCGFGRMQLTAAEGAGNIKTSNFAVNVDPAEGDLTAMSAAQLAARLMPEVQYEFRQASQYQFRQADANSDRLTDALLALMLVLLVGEQILAWSCGCHPSRPVGDRRGRNGHGSATAMMREADIREAEYTLSEGDAS